MKTDLFQCCGQCWVFQICWHIECSTFTASSFRIWNSTPLQYSYLKITWTEESGRLQSMGSLGFRHDWATSLSIFTFMHWVGNGNSLQCSFLENPRDGVAWWAAVYGVAQSRTRLKRLSRLLIQTLIRQFSLFPLSHGTCRSTSLSRQVNLTSLQNPKTGNTWFPSWSFQNRFFRMKEWT